ncbi:GNAT family N-acetyltransferase [Rouxiella silvae]|uniref:GNAT family N-acetyltransferase n=1 Tax=Rouxiella silvae TaxID=1646373 RepID=A0AA40X1Z6_9GAMM|nr:GNAT family N-acetyltransferase [Rouxiella silvae]KQN44325.1 acetyltransferase [Serratia sp. Leaf50]MBF6636769.1 GNAT family N-acetyltransferase [Rouxiella silvae]ORJ18808.1 GNAT family N-acetyltransferase [Rouxiella silvae]
MNFDIMSNDGISSVDWQRLADILELSGLNKRDLGKLKQGFEHSQFRYLGYCEGELVATARAISDFTSASYLSDVAIHPDFQGRGFGKILMDRVMRDLAPLGKVIIYAVPDKIEFYKRFSFHPLLTAMTYVEGENLTRMRQLGYIPPAT